ncbi:hypothetical protein BJX68DRAFT_60130 [Aspergillus pseudodeflectus]|uniref:Uncharacterized protein n=1 Tax=Aspergillus pseudodeflectus TaxID=176178 RepID=A0ABR4KIR4_9EURO
MAPLLRLEKRHNDPASFHRSNFRRFRGRTKDKRNEPISCEHPQLVRDRFFEVIDTVLFWSSISELNDSIEDSSPFSLSNGGQGIYSVCGKNRTRSAQSAPLNQKFKTHPPSASMYPRHLTGNDGVQLWDKLQPKILISLASWHERDQRAQGHHSPRSRFLYSCLDGGLLSVVFGRRLSLPLLPKFQRCRAQNRSP